jgi:hypothetical protein
MGGGDPLQNATFGQKMMAQAKEPLMVAVLVMLLGNEQVQSLIARFLPMVSSNPMIGLLVRGLIAGLLFFLLRRFVPT